MKRDWKIIRSILLGELNAVADKAALYENLELCIGGCLITFGEDRVVYLTKLGERWCGLLRDEARLDRALAELQAKRLGPASWELEALLKQDYRARAAAPNSSLLTLNS
jgi:hypothetical protein